MTEVTDSITPQNKTSIHRKLKLLCPETSPFHKLVIPTRATPCSLNQMAGPVMETAPATAASATSLHQSVTQVTHNVTLRLPPNAISDGDWPS